MKYGKLIVLENLGKIKPNDNHSYYKVKCECGQIEIARDTLLRTGKKIMCRKCYIKQSQNFKHGMTNTRLFHIWQGMNARCYRKASHAYKDYGGRGITICDEWRCNFINFYKWAMSNGYKEYLSIDRIDNNGNYEPSNCRWSTQIEQGNNQRTNRLLILNGETHTIAEWGRITGLGDYNIDNRLNKYGWTVEKTLTTPRLFTIKRHKKQ